MKKNFSFIVIILLINLGIQSAKHTCSENLFTGSIPHHTIESILNNMNQKRSDLANGKVKGKDVDNFPSISNMQKLYWEKDLEEKAQKFVEILVKKCEFAHNQNQYIGEKGYPTGENISKNRSYLKKTVDDIDADFTKSIKKWWDEKNLFTIKELEQNYTFDYHFGHFTQLAWPETSQVGCGYALYKNESNHFESIMLCNFAVEGNDIGRISYKLGKACTACPNHLTCSKKFNGLCGDDNHESEKSIAHHDPADHPGDPVFDALQVKRN